MTGRQVTQHKGPSPRTWVAAAGSVGKETDFKNWVVLGHGENRQFFNYFLQVDWSGGLLSTPIRQAPEEAR